MYPFDKIYQYADIKNNVLKRNVMIGFFIPWGKREKNEILKGKKHLLMKHDPKDGEEVDSKLLVVVT